MSEPKTTDQTPDTLQASVGEIHVRLQAAIARKDRLADDYEKLVRGGRILTVNEISMWKVLLKDQTDTVKALLASLTGANKVAPYNPRKSTKPRQSAA